MPTVIDYVDERLRAVAGRRAADHPEFGHGDAGGANAGTAAGLPPMAGRSLRPLIEGRAVASSGTAADGERRVVFSSNGVWRAATDGRYKLIHNLARGTYALYDLAADPQETADVLPDHRRDYHRLKAAMTAWLAAEEHGGDVEATREAQRRLRALGYLQ
jgi:arylsulfatase A-like enzyme